ncbi:MAG: dTDP-glucose 4,6-dehydratase [Candidatus Krumholzibacteria bacterium]|nr:dTDP-glucose 4,6-dehydratase [Candidatus Krumholzibacteria bacterium]MDH4336961.1 dTDP-glucose 4,6-dehydratase [Candidatus Krumholzibacteria bacterium]MDH5269743.1 dTDP-glucose 4,6-dehydratase [Candidatus Krumholzibacteria bacterium]
MAFKSILVTGGAGFIGSNFVRMMAAEHPSCAITVLDALTYAGNMENIGDLVDKGRVRFVKGNICDPAVVREAMAGAEVVFNFAAETHVDRSIEEAASFIETDIQGTYNLLNFAREFKAKRYVQISTDEVYGSSEGEGFTEESPLKPGNPYSASKCGGDLMCLAFANTYKLPLVITRSSNNFGPYQHVEKFIPLFTTNAMEGKELPLYGDGMHMRDWLFVEDNCRGIALVAEKGNDGEVYNIAVGNSQPNLRIAELIIKHVGDTGSKIVFIEDRKGHDRMYKLAADKVRALGWKPQTDFADAMQQTVRWYVENRGWWERVKSGAFREYYQKHYGERLAKGKARS